MKTTLNVSDEVMRRLKEQAARQGTTMSHLVESALRRFLDPPPLGPLPPLPTFDSGGHLVDIADRNALYEKLDAEKDAELYGPRR